MKIDKIFIATHKYDMRFTRICVASIRYWYPSIPIYLIKDYINGNFDTSEIETAWNVWIFETARKKFGWGFSKLEPLFVQGRERYLILDSDIVFVGRVLDYLDGFAGDFIVQLERQPDAEVKRLYFCLDEMRNWDPDFVYPDYTFNSGQLVATGGLIRREDFDDLVDWNTLPVTRKHPEVFTMGGDQGVLNYLLIKKAALNQLTVTRAPFMKYDEEELNAVDLTLLNEASPYPFLIHWAGRKKRRLRKMLRSDILLHFEAMYYAKVPLGSLKKRTRIIADYMTRNWGRFKVRGRKVWPAFSQLVNGRPLAKTQPAKPIS